MHSRNDDFNKILHDIFVNILIYPRLLWGGLFHWLAHARDLNRSHHAEHTPFAGICIVHKLVFTMINLCTKLKLAMPCFTHSKDMMGSKILKWVT